MKMFVDNPFPSPLVKQNSAIKYIDCSIDRKKLAIIDDFNNLFVYDL